VSDPTQVPPFAGTCRVVDGVVTELTGWANAHWATENDAVLIPDGVPAGVGWLYDGTTFTDPNPPTPETLPTEGLTDE
jgi:hypothetical protein